MDAANKPLWDGDAVSDTNNDRSIFMVGNNNNAPNAIKGAIFAKIKASKVKTIVFIWLNSIFGLDDEKVDKQRSTMLRVLERANNAPFFEPGFSLVDEIYFLPQKPGEKKLIPSQTFNAQQLAKQKQVSQKAA